MHNNIEYNPYVEAIKVAAGSVQYKNLSVKNTLIGAVDQLLYYYQNSEDKKYAETAVLHIQAYLEMGFSYDEGKEIFDGILEILETSRENKFPQKFYAPKIVKLNKSQVRNMIQRWPASSKQTIKINDLVEEIIHKVRNQENGIYYYKCAVTDDMYELVVGEDEVFFHDLRRGIFYTFVV